MAVELVNGQVRYSYDVGNSPRILRVNTRHTLNDNRWHDVAVTHQTLKEHVLRVDNFNTTDILPELRSFYFDMEEELYVGGLPKNLFGSLPKQVIHLIH